MDSIGADEKCKGKSPLLQADDGAYAKSSAAAAKAAPEEEEAVSMAEAKRSSSSEVKEPEPEEKPMLVLLAQDGVEVRISESAARMSQMLRHMIEDCCAGDRIPTPDVYSDVLEMVIQYCEKHGPYYDPEASERDRHPFPPFPVELTPTVSSIKPVTYVNPDPHGLKAWDKEFINLDNSTIFEITLAANYLNIQDLLDLCTTTVANKMRGKTPEELREIFEIENDYTLEQEAEIRRENSWAFED